MDAIPILASTMERAFIRSTCMCVSVLRDSLEATVIKVCSGERAGAIYITTLFLFIARLSH